MKPLSFRTVRENVLEGVLLGVLLSYGAYLTGLALVGEYVSIF